MTTDTVSAVLTASAITITKHDLMTKWANGIFNDLAYISCALEMEKVSITEHFEVDAFIERWEAAQPNSKKMKMKRLDVSSVLSCLGKLESKDQIELKTSFQIGLF